METINAVCVTLVGGTLVIALFVLAAEWPAWRRRRFEAKVERVLQSRIGLVQDLEKAYAGLLKAQQKWFMQQKQSTMGAMGNAFPSFGGVQGALGKSLLELSKNKKSQCEFGENT